jgi:hypothetical protein
MAFRRDSRISLCPMRLRLEAVRDVCRWPAVPATASSIPLADRGSLSWSGLSVNRLRWRYENQNIAPRCQGATARQGASVFKMRDVSRHKSRDVLQALRVRDHAGALLLGPASSGGVCLLRNTSRAAHKTRRRFLTPCRREPGGQNDRNSAAEVADVLYRLDEQESAPPLAKVRASASALSGGNHD